MTTIGFIGLGIMGTPMALNLQKAGHSLVTSKHRKAPAKELKDGGLKVLETPADVAKAADIVILMLPDTPQVNDVLFAENGVAFQSLHGMLFDQFATAAQAAVAGLGVALLPTFLIQDELKRGDLVAAIDREIESRDCYYLAYPSERADYAPLAAFREWIEAEAKS